MKKLLSMITILALTTAISTNVAAKAERKNQPKSRFVEENLAAIGDKHSPEKMDVKRITSIEIGETYYHIYEGELENDTFHIIVYDNYENYLGYYPSEYPPTNYEIEGSIVIDSGEIDDYGDPEYYRIPIDEKKGLPQKLQLGGIPTAFVKSPKYDEIAKGATGDKPAPAAGETTPAAEEETNDETTTNEAKAQITPEFREWTIRHKGTDYTVRAIYIQQTMGKVSLRAEASGVTKEFLLPSLSKKDQAYVKQFK